MEIATNLAHTVFSLPMGRESELRPVSIKSVYAYENDTKPNWAITVEPRYNEPLY